MRGNVHVRFGRRLGETDRLRSRNRAPSRPYTGIQAKAPTQPDTPPAPGRPARRGAARARVHPQRHAVPVRRAEGPSRRRARDGVQDPQPLRSDPLSRPSRRRDPGHRRPADRRDLRQPLHPRHPGSPGLGWRRTRAGAFSSPRRTPRGSTRSRSSSPSSSAACSSTAASPANTTSPSRCSPTTRPPSRSHGPTPARPSKHEGTE